MSLQIVVTFFIVWAVQKPWVEGMNNPMPFAPECQSWKNVTDRVTLLEHPNVTCTVNPPCTGFECNGKLDLPDKTEEMFRFGLSFFPCTDPLKFEVIADVPKYPFRYTLELGKRQTVHHSISVPGGTRSVGLFTIETNLTTLLISTISSNSLQLITIEANFTVQIDPPPRIESFVLIPRVTVPFPYCSGPPSVFSEDLTTSQAPDFSWTGAKCTYLAMDKGCEGEKQICTSSGRCACLPGLFWNAGNQQCNDNGNRPKTASKPEAWIIVLATVSAVVVVVGIIIMVIYKYRRYQERYGQHSPLVDRENDTELDDPDPPMLPA